MYQFNLGQRFEQVVREHGKDIALKFSPLESVTYEELNERANQISHFLRAQGIRQRDVVGIAGDKTFNTFACMLGCLKIGAIYTMLDPESPIERLHRIFSTCQPKMLFVRGELATKLDGTHNAYVIRNDSSAFEHGLSCLSGSNCEQTKSIIGTNPAYIMYTSGSTGVPKGAVMTHDNVLNLIEWSVDTFGVSSNDVFTNVNPLFFDNSVFDFYSSLFSGARLTPIPKEVVSDAKALVDAIDELECTSWFSVPSLLIYLQTMKAIQKGTLRSINRIIFGGEGYPKPRLKQLFETYADRTQFFNVYGPTECTCICSSYSISSADFDELHGYPPLGDISPNFSYLIIDAQGQPVRDNEPGELCLLGPNVGSGYYNDPERTEQSFVQNPCNSQYRETMYKTGDLVRYDPQDKKMHILGRQDNQIKHMGYRIELDEIETALTRLRYVSEATVLHQNHQRLSRLVGVVCLDSDKSAKEIKQDLRQLLPDYMIPTTFHRIGTLPKNANGKVDRKKLKAKFVGN